MSDTVVGYYQAAANVITPVGVISGAVANSLFRSFAELHGLKEDISLAFSYSVKYVSLILTPIIFFILAAASPLFDLFYSHAYSGGIVLLKLVAVSNLPIAAGLTVIPSFMNGVGKSRFTLVISITSAVAFVLASLVLILGLGLGAQGLMIALLVSNLAIVTPGLALAMKYLDVRLAPLPLVGIFLAGLVAWIAVALIPLGGFSSIWGVVFAAVVFLPVYLVAVPLFRGLNNDDLVRLSIAVETLGPLRRVFEAFLGFERRVLQLSKGS